MEGTAFSKALRSAREEKGWTRLQAYMKSLNISDDEIFTPDTLRKWETGGAGADEYRANCGACKTIQQAGAYPAKNKRSWL